MWFETLTGFTETTPENVRRHLTVEGEILTSGANNRQYQCGKLEIPTLAELRQAIVLSPREGSRLTLDEIVADVQELHANPKNAQSVFQAASQFNLLEMVGPDVTPEAGISDYEFDKTQGPACAIACGAGTIYRNYFVPLGDQIGQTHDRQIDCLAALGEALENATHHLWDMRNGYALATRAGLHHISSVIHKLDETGYEPLKGKLKVGIQWNTEVTIAEYPHTVTQVYCSALPLAYSQESPEHWQPFAQLILDATYEATFYTAFKNYTQTGNPDLYLTLVGGGAFGNATAWILRAIERACHQFAHTPLRAHIVSYRESDPIVKNFIQQMNFTGV